MWIPKDRETKLRWSEVIRKDMKEKGVQREEAHKTENVEIKNASTPTMEKKCGKLMRENTTKGEISSGSFIVGSLHATFGKFSKV